MLQPIALCPSMTEMLSVQVHGSRVPASPVDSSESAPLAPNQVRLQWTESAAVYGNGKSLDATARLNGTSSGHRHHTSSSSPAEKKPLSHLPERQAVEVAWQDIEYTVPDKKSPGGTKIILKGLSGASRPGEIMAIMGPSGAGKSTLMNVLAGFRLRRATGSVLINGRERDLHTFRKNSCYIMQDDLLLPHLSVLEACTMSANLRLPEKIPRSEKQVMINEILEAMGLLECQHTRTKNLSGGQRKRLSIALELVNNPPVMFFDEPTSGLDSSSCYQCINLLRFLAQGGRTIICTIHQPSAKMFELFDKLYMLADGQCIYSGAVKGLIPFMSSMSLECPPYHNPADFVIEVASGEYGDCIDKLVDAVRQGGCRKYSRALPRGESDPSINTSSSNGTSDDVPNKHHDVYVITNSDDMANNENGNPPCQAALLVHRENADLVCHTFSTSFFTQFRVLFLRTFLSILRDRSLTQLRLVSHISVAVLIGLLYYKIGNDASKVFNNAASLFFNMMFLMFTSLMPTVLTFPLEMPVLVRERLNSWYSVKAYFIAKSMADFPFQVIFPIIYMLIVYFMTDQPQEWFRFGVNLAMCIMVSLVAQSLGLFVSAFLDVQNATFLGPVLGAICFLFAGFYISIKNLPSFLKWAPNMSFLYFCFRSSITSIYSFDRADLYCKDEYCHFSDPIKFLEEMGMESSNLWIDFGALVAFLIAFRLAAYVSLRIVVRLQS